MRVNLTAKRPIEWVVRELLYDTFFLCSIIKGTPSVLDMGSGSGILGIPLAILDEGMQVFSVDRTLRKIQFQRHVKRSLKLNDLYLIHGRIESLEPLNVDALLSKGFGSTRLILQKGGAHLKEKGAAYLLKGRTERGDSYQGFFLEHVSQYRLPKSPKEYQLFVYKKVS
jgi:16S rRNA (guanine527-N7)-methyltransferase